MHNVYVNEELIKLLLNAYENSPPAKIKRKEIQNMY